MGTDDIDFDDDLIDGIVMRERVELTEDAILDLTALWVRLTDALDYHHKKWYAPDEKGDWKRISEGNIFDLIESLEVRVEPVVVIQEFKRRDKIAHARLTADVRRARERFGKQQHFDFARL